MVLQSTSQGTQNVANTQSAFILNNGWITGFSGVLINCDPAGICFLPEDHVCPSAFLVLTVESCLSRPLPCVQVERDREILIKALN